MSRLSFLSLFMFLSSRWDKTRQGMLLKENDQGGIKADVRKQSYWYQPEVDHFPQSACLEVHYSSYTAVLRPTITFNVAQRPWNRPFLAAFFSFLNSRPSPFSSLSLDSQCSPDEAEKACPSWRRPSRWWRRWWSGCNERTRLWKRARGRRSKSSSPPCSTSMTNSRFTYCTATPEHSSCLHAHVRLAHQSRHSSRFVQAEYDRMKERNQLTSKLESQAKGLEKIVMENERLRRDIRKVSESFGCVLVLRKVLHNADWTEVGFSFACV